MFKYTLILALLVLVSGCGKDDLEDDIESTELAYYESAQSSLRGANYSTAVSKLQLLEARFPFGRYAEQAQLEIIYAYYKSVQTEAARAAADRFIRLHPRHPNVDYAYYLKGLASFEADENFLAKLFPLDPSTRDPGAARDSFDDFAQLIRRFPNSEYAPDAQRRMQYLKNLLAASEVNIARYYIYRGAYVAAANRGRYVFEQMQGTAAVPDALAIMVEAYLLLGMEDLAGDALLVLSSNYPEHNSLNSEGQFRNSKSVKSTEKSWLNIITFGLMG